MALHIENMTCGGCANAVQSMLAEAGFTVTAG